MLRKGLKRAPVLEADAKGRTREIYDDIKDALGVPHVDVVLQAYGAYPEFLELLWTSVQPALRTQDFFVLADRLRADAYTRAHSYLAVPDFCAYLGGLHFTDGARKELSEATELAYYSDPMLLMLVVAISEAFDNPLGHEAQARPATHPVFERQPLLISEALAPSTTRRIYDDIVRVTGSPVVNTSYRALARWPDFLSHYWSVLRPITSSAVYHESQFGVADAAVRLARELPAVLDLREESMEKAGISDQAARDLELMTKMFVKSLAGLALNTAIAKVGLEGGTSSGRKQYPATVEKKVA